VVETDLADEARGFSEVSPLTETLGYNVASFWPRNWPME